MGEQSGTGEDRIAFIVDQDVSVSNHFHGPAGEPYASTNNYATATEVRENDLWNYRLSLLIAQENTNNA